jgi:hypothetical protein
MSENYGFLYQYIKGKEGENHQLRYWKIHPRINTTIYGRVAFDTGIITEDELIKILEDKEQKLKEGYQPKKLGLNLNT